ncbi:MAG TPA: peptide chain release factor N(5)-glutamine methyltransferase [Lachnospiraceae bacterium]|nr:peptide chain release factor N(5)-glutamine methyltransferase [Lachnospiraceae bacterium]
MTYRELYDEGVKKLTAAGVAEAELDARLLLEFVCHTDRNYMLTYGDERITNDFEESYVNLLQERCKRIPLQYIIEETEFMGLKFYVNQDVLIPRQDTECLVEEAMKELHDGMSVLDMCAGSGCIAISLIKYKNDIRGVAVDISDKALGVARHNSLTHGVTEQLRLVESDLFENKEEIRRALNFLTDACSTGSEDKFDCIISNPPYIRSAVIEELAPEVKDNEPRIALDGTADGLHFYREIAKGALDFLVPGGMIFFEIGFDQGADVSDILIENGYEDVRVTKDLAGNERVVSARLSNR